jgi:hypothetical protein
MSTPIQFPFQRSIRTFLQAVAGTVLVVAAAIPALNTFAPQFLEALQEVLPPQWYAWGLAAVGVIGVVAATLARIMAIPGVNEWLTKWGAGSTPKGAQFVADVDTGVAVGLTRKQYREYLQMLAEDADANR